MQIHILASGSTGNAVFIELGKKRFLLDAGISNRRIERGLAKVGASVGDLDAVLITHEHTDHIKGLDVLVRKHGIPVYARPAAWQQIPARDRWPAECRCRMDAHMDFGGGVYMECFPVSHDAVDPVGFCFYYQHEKYVLATDTGMITSAMVKAISGARVAVIESNHDLEMLRTGPYPAFLKYRILSERGHLSNLDTGRLLTQVSRGEEMQVFLAHLSQKNNEPDLAEATVSRMLEKNGCRVGQEVILHRTYPDRISSYAG